ncbi:MAG: pyridoxine 5'-phosphate synthase [Bacteroidales bacterium]
MTRLSVNINKIATLRNARGGNIPNVFEAAINCERFGAEGITVHPRPDERHIKYQDVRDIRPVIQTEFNIEGYPSESFMELVIANKPDQVTLVPDPPGALTSNQGWNTIENKTFLKNVIEKFQQHDIRTSIFIETNTEYIKNAKETGTNRVELYTEPYASLFHKNKEEAIEPFIKAAEVAHSEGLELNAGHDLDLFNLKYFSDNIPHLKEVSIGHALISDSLYYGLENTIQLYLRQLR